MTSVDGRVDAQKVQNGEDRRRDVCLGERGKDCKDCKDCNTQRWKGRWKSIDWHYVEWSSIYLLSFPFSSFILKLDSLGLSSLSFLLF